MKRFVGAALVLPALAACVPTDPDRQQLELGGLSITFAPSEATAGAPFQTRDGWTVKIETTAIRVLGQAQPVFNDSGGYGYGGYGQPHVVDPRYVCEIRVTQMMAGQVNVDLNLSSDQYQYQQAFKEGDLCAISEATARRFQMRSDDADPTPANPSEFDYYDYQNNRAPSVYVKGFAQKDGRRLAFDLTLAVDGSGRYTGYPDSPLDPTDTANAVTVVANQGTPVRFEVHFEALFARGIDELAAADANKDGFLAPEELRAVQLTCDSSYGDDEDDDYSDDDDDYTGKKSGLACRTLMEQLVTQASTIVGPQVKP